MGSYAAVVLYWQARLMACRGCWLKLMLVKDGTSFTGNARRQETEED